MTGIETTPAELMRGAERAWNMYKLLNVRAGFNREDDRPREAWFKPIKAVDREYAIMDYFRTTAFCREDVEGFVDDYVMKGGGTGRAVPPTVEKLKELGIALDASQD